MSVVDRHRDRRHADPGHARLRRATTSIAGRSGRARTGLSTTRPRRPSAPAGPSGVQRGPASRWPAASPSCWSSPCRRCRIRLGMTDAGSNPKSRPRPARPTTCWPTASGPGFNGPAGARHRPDGRSRSASRCRPAEHAPVAADPNVAAGRRSRSCSTTPATPPSSSVDPRAPRPPDKGHGDPRAPPAPRRDPPIEATDGRRPRR